jgi:multiple sugar transport system substrate-binding protein
LLSAAAAAALLAGCSLTSKDAPSQAEPVTIKVMYYDERSFYDQYGMLFSALHPEVEIEVVNTQAVKYEEGKDMNQAMLDYIDEQKPDILMLSPDQYSKMAEEGRLLELDSRIEEKSFGKDGLMPGMLDYLRDMSGGKVYGLVTDFFSQAVYYNKDLFDRYGIDPPRDKMSWDELLRLAEQFPTDGPEDERVYGLSMNYMQLDLYQLGNMIGMTQNLSYIDASGKPTIRSDAWRRVFETALTALKSGALYQPSPDSMNGAMSYEEFLMKRNPFLGGRAAMTIEGYYLMSEIKQAQEMLKDKGIRNWDVVTMPVDPANPDVSPNVSFNQILAISAKSGQIDAAWKFLKYIVSDEFARVTSKRQTGSMPVRTTYFKDDAGHHLEAFYALKPIQPAMYKNYDKVPSNFGAQFYGLASQELQSAFSGEKTVQEALESLQTKAEDLIHAAPKESQAPSAPSSGG